MKLRPSSLPLFSSLVALVAWALATAVSAQTTATQTLTLQPGWNSVWLEVEPRGADGRPRAPGEVFLDARLSTVAALLPETGPAQFLSDPAETFTQNPNWAVWYRQDPSRRSTLTAIQGDRAYLMLVTGTSPLALSLTGEVRFHVYRWVPDSYNFLGFGVVPTAKPSFDTFFGPAGAKHPVGSIFRMNPATGNWEPVSGTDTVEPGTAYWIYANGNSTYQGPFRVDVRGVGELGYGATLKDQELLFFNEDSGRALNLSVERVAPPNGLELVHLLRDPTKLTETEGGIVVNFPINNLPARESAVETFRIKRNWTDTQDRRQLYRVSSGSTYSWLPVSGSRLELAPATESTPMADSAGLWVGEVAIQGVSGRVPATRTLVTAEPVPSGPKPRILLHVSGSGTVSLLKAVTVMRKRTGTDTNVQQVLVVDADKLPFYEGIEQRGGRLVGKRIETTYYDLPRTVLPPEPLPTNFDRSTLREDYRLTLAMNGGVGPGRRCSTDAAGLVLDPWHRTNPFRHAFHPQHTAGYRVVRGFQFDFDSLASDAAKSYDNYGQDILVGTMTETFEGLVRAQERIQVTGRFVLRRVSRNAVVE